MSFRVGGLVTGLDTNSLVDQLMQLERRPLVALQTRAKELAAQQKAWQNIDSRINAFETALTKLADFFQDSVLKVESSSDALSAVKTGDVSEGTWRVKIERLASQRTIASDAFTTAGPGEFTFNGFTVQLDGETDINGVAQAINAAGSSKYSYTATTAGEILVSGTYRGETDAQLVMEVQDRDLLVYKNGELVQTFSAALDETGTGSVSYDGLNVSFSQAETADSVDIQAAAARETGAAASVIDGRLVLNSVNHEPIVFSDPQGILEQIGILDALGNEKNVLVEGTTALVRVNGLLVERDSNTIDDVLQGITFTLRETGEQELELTATQDKTGIKDNLTDIISQFNALLKELGPQGSVAGDTMAYRLETSLRRTLSSVTGSGGEVNSLGAVGITTNRSGVLELSAEKLEAVIESDFSALKDLMLGEKGLAETMKSACQVWAGYDGLIKARMDTYRSQIRSNESSILRAEDRIQRKEEQLWRQFTAMERAISTIQSQGNWLAGQLSSLPGYMGTAR